MAQRTVRFFAIDTVNLDRGADGLAAAVPWASPTTDWEIGFYHHPIYTSGRYSIRRARLRRCLNRCWCSSARTWRWPATSTSTSASSHSAACCISPQAPAAHFGWATSRKTNLTAAGFDTDTHFMLMEISGDELYFQAISRTGQTVDSGSIKRLERPPPPPSIR